MAGPGQKKAKLAHEKRADGQGQSSASRFALAKIVSAVDWPEGQSNIIVDINGEGQLAIIPSRFAMADPKSGELVPSLLASPVTYDHVSRQRAIDTYAAYAATQS